MKQMTIYPLDKNQLNNYTFSLCISHMKTSTRNTLCHALIKMQNKTKQKAIKQNLIYIMSTLEETKRKDLSFFSFFTANGSICSKKSSISHFNFVIKIVLLNKK